MPSSAAATVDQYLQELPDEKRLAMQALRESIAGHLPKGFEEVMQYGMISYVVPHTLYPSGYHCDPKQPLPFIGIAAQKNHFAVYHMGIYANPVLLKWFQDKYASQYSTKLDMGKSCLRFKKAEQIPVPLIGELASKLTPANWIDLYEKSFRR